MILGCIASFGVVIGALLVRLMWIRVARAKVRTRLSGGGDTGLMAVRDESVSMNLTLMVVGIGISLWALFQSGVVLSVLAAFGMVVVLRIRARLLDVTHKKAREEAIPELLESVVRQVRSGASVLAAYEEVAKEAHLHSRLQPIAHELSQVLREVTLGSSFVSSLAGWSVHSQDRAVQSGVLATLVSYDTGASTAKGLDAASSAVLAALEGQQLARTHAAQAVVSAGVLAVMPVVVTGGLLVMHGGVREFLLHSAIGVAVLVVGLVFNGIGLWWMNRIIRSVTA